MGRNESKEEKSTKNSSFTFLFQEAMNVLNFSAEEQDFILRTTAGILHLGNIDFEDKGSGVKSSTIKDQKRYISFISCTTHFLF